MDEHEEFVYFGVEFCITIALFEDVFDGSVFFNVGEVVVGVFAGTIDMVERLFVEESSIAVSGIGFSHDLHHQHVLIDSDTGLSEDAGDLELVDSHLVVTGLEGDTDLQQFFFNLLKGLLND